MQGSGGAAILLLVLLLQSAAPNSAQSSTTDVIAANLMAIQQQPGDGPGTGMSPQPDGSPEPAPTDDAMADAPSSTSAGKVCNVTTLTFPDTLFNGERTASVPSGYGGLAWSPGSNMTLETSSAGAVRTVNTTGNFTLKSLWALVIDNRLDIETADNPRSGGRIPDLSYTVKIVARKANGRTLEFPCQVKVESPASLQSGTAGSASGASAAAVLASLGAAEGFPGAGVVPEGPPPIGTRCDVPADMDFSNLNALDFDQINEATVIPGRTNNPPFTAGQIIPPERVSNPPPKRGQVAVFGLQYQLHPPCLAP